MIAGIILAGGESRRMGALKPTLKINNITFIQHITQQLELAGVSSIIVVLGYKPEVILEHARVSTDHVINVHYRLGQFSSLQTGVHALPKACTAAVVCLGDQPQIHCDWIKALISAHQNKNGKIIIPEFNGKSGHPVLYDASLFAEIKSMPPSGTARDFYANLLDSIVKVPIESDGILYDADTPQDLDAIQSRFMTNRDCS